MYGLLMLVAAAMLVAVGVLHWLLRRALMQKREVTSLTDYPSVTVIRPIKGLDVEAEENMRAALDHGYPGTVETIFVFDDENEPALPIAKRVIHELENDEARILFCGAPPKNRTGKLNAMIAGLEVAKGEVIVFADSDIRPEKGTLSELVATLMRDEKAGAAFCPVVVPSPAKTVGDAGYAILLNGIYGPAAALSARRNQGRMPFIMGQLMALKREAIDALEGLSAAEGQFVDDMYLGAHLASVGYDNVVCPRRVPIIQHGVGNREFLGIFNRWLTFGRTGLPDPCFRIAPILQFALFWLGALTTLACTLVGSPSVYTLVPAMLLAPITMLYSVISLHHRLGGAHGRTFRGALVVLLLGPLLYAGVFFRHEINWRGRVYKLDEHSRLG
jgi:ceramide glucosyltransferase